MNSPGSALPPGRCPVCGTSLATAGWCPRCALDEAIDPEEALHPKSPGTFTIAGHVILGELGRGGAGLVYRAQQQNPAREVALKILLPHEAASENSRARFRLEASTVAMLDHPAILPVLTVGEHDGLPYFTMKLCRGGSLAERVARYRGAWRDIGTLLATLADAVQHAHMRGVLHRDLKPGNVLFDEADRPFVSDFGIAKSLTPTNQGIAPLTRPQVVMGTQGYLAPEILTTGVSAATLSADVYALGAILFELLSGAPPVAGTTPRPPAKSTLLQHDLFVIALKCLRAEPAARYASAGALAEDLRAALAGRAIAARPMPPAAHAMAWARRNPALAGLAAALILTVVASAVALAIKNRALETAFHRSQASLAESLVAQAAAVRHTGGAGQRTRPLELLAQAARIAPSLTARSEAAAALARPDWLMAPDRKLWPGVAFFAVPTPDFQRVLTEDGQGNFSLRDVTSAALRWSWHAPAKCAGLPVFSADARWLAVRLMDDSVHVLAADRGTERFALVDRPYAFKDSALGFGRDLDFSPDGSRLAVTRPAGGVSFHRVPGGENDGEWNAPEWVTYLAFSPDGKTLAAGAGKNREQHGIALVDAASGQLLVRQTSARRVDFLAWSPDGRVLASRAVGGMTELHAARDLALLTTIPDRDTWFGQFLPGGQQLLLSGQFGRTRLWDIKQSRTLLELDDNGRPGSWFSNEPLRLWRSFGAGPVVQCLFSKSPVLNAADLDEDVTSVSQFGGVAAAPDGRSLVVGGRGGGYGYDLTRNASVDRFPVIEANEVVTMRVDSEQTVWIAHTKSGLWRQPAPGDRAAGETKAATRERVDQEPGFFCADLNLASAQLALVRPTDGVVKIIDLHSARESARWVHLGAVAAAFSPDGTALAVNAQFREQLAATVHDVKTGKELHALGREAGSYVAWSPDGRWIYAGEGSGRAALWRTSDWMRGPKLETFDDDQMRAGIFSPDGKILALVDSIAGLRLIDTTTGKNLISLSEVGSVGLVAGMVFTAPDRLCVVGSQGRIQTWDLAALHRELDKLGLAWNSLP